MHNPNDLINPSQGLAAKVALLMQLMCLKSELKNARRIISRAGLMREDFLQIAQITNKYEVMAKKNLQMAMNEVAPTVAQLAEAKLEDKRHILDCMPIVTVPLSAAFLGMSEAPLYWDGYGKRHPFCYEYQGAQCYSMNDLLAIKQLPELVSVSDAYQHDIEADLPPATALDHAIFVDIKVAMAFTNLSELELNQQVRQSPHPRRPYRLAELEKIRIAKMKVAA